ncbi:DNA polymerase III subunit beta [Streptomyces luteocolor]|uniref:DNA polymerase III subunit beta n=1 Tax=Streptomyces luteocolor TaxID=285500 RepID=UPI000853BF7D|nr:DNA polymerase III subunit beta [Streptomyces luteocolor]
MKLQLEQAELADAARWIARHIPHKAAEPTTLAVLLTAHEDGLTVAYSDTEITASVTVDAHVVTPGRHSIGGRMFSDILSALPPVAIDLTGDDNGVDLTAGTNDFHLEPLDARSYPSLPSMPPLSGSVPGDLFATAVASVASAYNDTVEAVPSLGGIRIMPIEGDRLQFLATDRYRVPIRTIPWMSSGEAVPALLPGRALADIAKTAGGAHEVQLSLTSGLAGIQTGERTSVSRLMDITSFPAADRLFPKEFVATLTCDTEELVEAVKRIRLLLEGAQAIELCATPDQLTVQAMRNVKATGKARIACQLEGADTFDIAFDPQFLLDALQPVEGPVAIDMNTPIKPVVVCPTDGEGDYRCLLMPIRDPEKAAG